MSKNHAQIGEFLLLIASTIALNLFLGEKILLVCNQIIPQAESYIVIENMKGMDMNSLTKAILTAAALAVSAPVVASGGGGGGGFSGSGSSGSSSSRTPRSPAKADFSRGKSYFKKYITCKKCSYSNGVNDSVTAEKVAKKVRSGEISVKEKHKRQLLFYISRRYRIRA